MKYFAYIFFICCSCITHAQIISTFDGNGMVGYSGDGGAATAAAIAPGRCSFDHYGNFYFTDGVHHVVRKITPGGNISTIAGTGTGGYNGDNIPATNAKLNIPVGITLDTSNNIFIADGQNQRVRKIDALTGIITTIAGTGGVGYGGDGGSATAALFNGIENIFFDKTSNLYILDYGNYRVRKINTSGIISTVAGNGIPGDSGDGGMATLANIEDMVGICTDQSGNFYFSESGLRVRKVTIATGIISSIAGIDTEGLVANGDGGPATSAALDPYDLTFDKAGNLYVAGYLYNDVRKIDDAGIIHTIAGTGVAGYNGDGIPAIAAELNSPVYLTLDTCGNLYISEIRNYRIRKLAINPLCLPLDETNLRNGYYLNSYPNPTDDQLNINNIKTNCIYRLLNLTGNIVQQGILKEGDNSISILAIPNGMYMLEITDEEKNRTVNKIVKQ